MTYVQLNRESLSLHHLLQKRPTAFLLLTLIAIRAKRSNNHPDKTLEVGECYVGDYVSYGVSEQIYRNDKTCLKSTGQATFRSTNKGTIAKLTNSNVFNINLEQEQRPKRQSNQRTNEQDTNEQTTTNNNGKEINKENILKATPLGDDAGFTKEAWRLANTFADEQRKQQGGSK